MIDNMSLLTNNYEETEKAGEIMGKKLPYGIVVALSGNLGSGKTTFIKGLAKGLGIKRTVASPTFLMIKKYEIKGPKRNIKRLYHIDCYRIKTASKLQSLGIEEILGDKEAVIAVEWPERIKKILPKNIIKMKFKWLGENRRKIDIRT